MMRGIDKRHEVDPSILLRDTRTIGQRIKDFLSNPTNATIILLALAAFSFYIPALTPLLLIAGVLLFVYGYSQKQVLPFRLPKIAGVKDYNDLKPGIGTPNIARGITYFGREQKTGEELWFSNEDMRTHVLIFGSTGSGKTEALISLAYNALIQASGFIYVDGKGDNALYAKIFSMVRTMGREDDLLLVNFMTGARDIIGPQEKRLSNTLNPFCQGSSSMLSNLITSLMSSKSESSNGDMWKGRAISFVEALMKLLVYMRDEGAILLDANTIRNYFSLQRLEAIVVDKVFPRDDQDSLNIDSIPKLVTDPLRNYLENLPGYNREKKGKQVSQVLEQHGFITMQLTRTFSSLADTYGHIIRTNLAEVDFKDVVLNRRILVVLLPALEKSPDELSNLGKVIVSSLKAMMAAGLGEDVEGDYRDVIGRKPTYAATPYMCILDEYGYYAVEGFAVVPAQARSLGFSVIFAGQDLPAFQKASKEEAASIGANTNIKICMKLEDPTETWDFFTKTAGEAYVTKVDAFSRGESSVVNTYTDTNSSSFEKRARVDLLDLKEQTEGAAHIFFRSNIVRVDMFYANPLPVPYLKVNQFLKIESPSEDYLYRLKKQLYNFSNILKSNELSISATVVSEEISHIKRCLDEARASDPIERAVAALMAYHKDNDISDMDFVKSTPIPSAQVISEQEGSLTIFTPLRLGKDALPILVQDKEAFAKPLIDLEIFTQKIAEIERLSGAKEKYALTVANELIKDLKKTTFYPPDVFDEISIKRLAELTFALCDNIVQARQKSKEGA